MGSKIKQIVLENFIAFSNAIIDFDDGGIINLKGYSDSGKSSILIAIAVVFSNFKSSKQASWIKDDCKYFRITVSFDDGVEIVRHKYSNGQSMYEMFKMGSLVYSSKVNGQLTPINEVPEVIANYLNLAKLESGILNFRTNQDKQFLAQTTGRENFQDLNSLFGIEEILWAINTCKAEIAEYSNEMQKNDVEIEFLKGKVKETEGVSQETLVRVLEEDKRHITEESNLSSLGSISGDVEVLKRTKVVSEIPEINTQIDKVLFIHSLVEVLAGGEPVSLGEVSEGELKSLLNISSIIDILCKEKDFQLWNEVSVDKIWCLLELERLFSGIENPTPELDVVEDSKRVFLSSVSNHVNSILKINNEIKSSEEEMLKMKGILDKVKKVLKSKGYTLHECSNCGSFSIEGGGLQC